MKSIPCPELCPDCPLKGSVGGGELEIEQGGGYIIEPELRRGSGQTVVSLDFERGVPQQNHLIEVGIVAVGEEKGQGFWVKPALGVSGVANAIEICDGPVRTQTGFMKLRKTMVCGAVLKFAEKVEYGR